MTSGLIKQNPPLISLALYFQAQQKIQVLAHNLGIKSPTVKIFAVMNQFILAYRFVFQDNIVGVEEDQVDVAESGPRQVCENVQLPGMNPPMARHDCQI